MPRPCHALTMPWPWEERHGQSMAWARHGHGMASVNQIGPHCVNQMEKTHSKSSAAQHGRGTAWARHAMCESAFTVKCSSCHTVRERKLGRKYQKWNKSTKHSYRWWVKNRDYCTYYISHLNWCCRILLNKLTVTPSVLTVNVCYGADIWNKGIFLCYSTY
jgi:hypothetical protein